MSSTLIDEFLPDYDVYERHRTAVHAPIEDVYSAVRQLDISSARFSRLLFRLRGIPTTTQITLENFLKIGFILLGERPNEEILLGLVGRFWSLKGDLQRLDAEGYRTFNKIGYAKTAWNFTLTRQSDNTVLLETETRVHCLDDNSRRRFRLYWTLIGPFSALIRRDALRAIKRNAEKLAAAG